MNFMNDDLMNLKFNFMRLKLNFTDPKFNFMDPKFNLIKIFGNFKPAKL